MELFSIRSLYDAFVRAYRGREKTKEVIKYQFDLESNLVHLQRRLLSFEYKHFPYRHFIVSDSKKRFISAPSFEDHILHHILYEYLYDIFSPIFIFHSFANLKHKGSHKAIKSLRNQLYKFDFFMKMDITKYFQSIDKEILFSQIQRRVSDKMALYYILKVIESYEDTTISNPFTNNSTGIPIGNVTSQLFANIYLHDLDFYIEHTIKPRMRQKGKDIFYIRYVDDFIFLTQSLEDTLLLRDEILSFLQQRLKLSVSSKKLIINRITNGISFLGYTLINGRIKVKNDTLRRFRRKISSYDEERKIRALMSFKGHCDIANPHLIQTLAQNSLSIRDTNIFKPQNFKCSLNELPHKKCQKIILV
ncbi:MAG: reverse transcriptase/maturase family protein [Candidatus Nanoarchaeia archaeon]